MNFMKNASLGVKLKLDIPKVVFKFKSLFWGTLCLALLLSQLSFAQERSEERTNFEYPIDIPKVDLKTQKYFETLSPDSSVVMWVFFKDKGIESYAEYKTALELCRNQLSDRSIKRRMLRGQSPGLDFTDIPVNKEYLVELENSGLRIRVVSKWLNAASVMANKQQIEKVKDLPFIRAVKKVVTFIRREPLREEKQLRKMGGTLEKQVLGYGESYDQ
jgi:hypothetical protein